MISLTKILLAAACLMFPALITAADSEHMKPRFVGTKRFDTLNHALSPSELFVKNHSYSYMTASEMQSKIASLTGFVHTSFDTFADAIGRFDPKTGLRTNDHPSLVSILFMQKISASIAEAVVEREIFLDDDERIVFSKVDLIASPNDFVIKDFVQTMLIRWLGEESSAASVGRLINGYRVVEKSKTPTDAYKWLLSMLIRHGGLYYY